MNILVISQYYYPEQFIVNEITEELAKQGHQVTVLTGLPNYPEGKIYPGYRFFRRRKENINNVRVIRTPLIARGKSNLRLFINYLSFWLTSSIRARFLRGKYDAIYIYQISPVLQIRPGVILKKKKKAPLIVHCCDIWPEALKARGLSENSLVFKIFKKISARLYQKADKVLVSSRSFIPYLEEVNGVNPLKIAYLPQYADENLLSLDLTKEPNDYIDLLYTGNIGQIQNIEDIIEAARIIKSKNVRFHIVGNGSNFKKCFDLVKEYNLEEKVIMYGKRDYSEMPNFYKQADACLLTLSGKTLVGSTLPLKMQGYMAAGKPIIGAIAGDAKIIIEEANCGYNAEPDDYVALARVIDEFYSCPNKAILGENSRLYFNQHFTKDKFFHDLIIKFKEEGK